MNTRIKLILISFIAVVIMGCDNVDDHTYEIQVVNLTNNQPLSPAVIIAHATGYSAFNEAEAASLAIETLAESGDNSELTTEAEAADEYLAHASTELITPKTASEVVTISVPDESISDLRLSVVSMLVNTNDAITGLDEADISNMALNDSVTLAGLTWDAGTELNTESSGTIPGPADGGTGFDATRDDILNKVRIHQGAVTSDDGLSTSVLNESHRFLNPSSSITITRTQ